jgi:DNA-directed RNA polymerase
MDLQASLEATIDRFNKRQERVALDQGEGAAAGPKGITKLYLKEVAEFISKRLEENPKAPARAFVRTMRQLDPYVIACCALSETMHGIANGATLRTTSLNIGYGIQGECWAKGLLAHDAKLHARINRTVRARHANVKYRRQSARSIAASAGYRSDNWSQAELVKAGSWLLACVVKALPEIFYLEEHGGRKVKYPQITPEGAQLADEITRQVMATFPVFLPSLELPKPWEGAFKGGYWDERTVLRSKFLRSRHKATNAATRASFAAQTIRPHADAVNSLQSVPWCINTPVLAVVKWAYENAVPIDGLPSIENIPVPERLSDDEWETCGEEARKLQRYKISRAKERNRGLKSNRVLFAEDVGIASRLAGAPFYTPTNCDWRGRVYSLPHFNFQRDDRVRALFMFAHGLPIGTEGLYWLKVHTANCYGVDKVSFAERVKWVEQNSEKIKAVAWDPKGTQEVSWWSHADKPFLFMAACMELTSAMAGSSFLMRLPVSFDGSCSGLQHLCAMTRAPEGALVNLTPQAAPQDVYQVVADLVRARVEEDAKLEYGVGPLAKMCLDYGITRKLVKRNVMTYSYSSKAFGMGGQHMEDTMRPLSLEVLEGKREAHPFDVEGDEGRKASKYIAEHVYAAIETVVSLPAQAMTFLQKLARALAHEGKPLNWTTPTGVPWSNRYHEIVGKHVELWLSDIRISVVMGDDTPKIDKTRASNGVAPNFVHALDASHLAMVVNAAVSEGITALATVHDSFGCLAPQAGRFRKIIREQFVRMYQQHDVLAEVLEAAKRDLTVHNHGRLPTVPVKGPLDLNEVLRAEYAFA